MMFNGISALSTYNPTQIPLNIIKLPLLLVKSQQNSNKSPLSLDKLQIVIFHYIRIKSPFLLVRSNFSKLNPTQTSIVYRSSPGNAWFPPLFAALHGSPQAGHEALARVATMDGSNDKLLP